MSAHTPGPWKHGDLSGEILAGAQTVASMPEVDGRDEEWEEVCANARLIAAAPDLLAALEDACEPMCDYCRTVGEGRYPQDGCEASPKCHDRQQQWFRALAKAVGK